MNIDFSLKDLDLELDVRYSGRDEFVKISNEYFTKQEAAEFAIKLQSASAEIFSYLERDLIQGLSK